MLFRSDFLTGQTFTGNYDLPSHGVLVLDESVVKEQEKQPGQAEESAPAPAAEAGATVSAAVAV